MRTQYGAQHRQESRQSFATRYSINPKPVAKWHKRPRVKMTHMGFELASMVRRAACSGPMQWPLAGTRS